MITVIAGTKIVINDLNRDIKVLLDRENILLEDLKESRNEIDVLKEIMLRDKRELQKLQEEIERLRTIRARVTSYAPYDNKSGICSEGDPSKTATGKKTGPQYAAADPARLPYGTKLYIPNYGEVIIADTGGALRQDKDNLRIDVFSKTYREAMEWGVKELDVKILE